MRAYPSFPGALLLVFAFLLLSGVIGFGLGLLWTALPYPVSPQLSGAIGNTLITALLLALIFRFKQNPRPVLAALRRFPRSAAVVTGIVLATVGLHVIASELTNLVRFVMPIPESIRELLSQLTGKQNLGASLLLLVVVAPVTEELLLRGVVLDGFLRNYRRTTAVLLSALVFGLMHANPWQFVGGALIGVYLGLIYLYFRSLGACMLVHAVNNAIPLLLIRGLGAEIGGYAPGNLAEKSLHPLWFDLTGLALLAGGILLVALTGPFGRRGGGRPGTALPAAADRDE
jgi:hypothetical protein